GPERANQVLRAVPMQRIAWDIHEPGHFETDLVHHCGREASGEYLHTLQLIDVATGWSERMAVLGRGYLVMQAAFRRGLARLPFAVLEIHPDNGSEFFNQHMVRFWQEVVSAATLSRSHPYQKNDNRNVEQKNSSLVRAYLGFARLDSGVQTLALNELYDQMWLYYNLFQPVLHLAEKTLVVRADDRPHVQRRYDVAQTPFDRLCATTALIPERRTKLARLRDATNPRWLRQDIYDRLERLWTLPGATAGVTEDVHALLDAIAQPASALL
ncbi:MAG: integrase, partial [Chloroflexota bacterium]|nr:integrase [Chloroflexota bacterium]